MGSITRALKEAFRADGDLPYARFTLGTSELDIRWMRNLPRSARFELGDLVRASNLSLGVADGVIEDWVEEHGGDRRMAFRLRYALCKPGEKMQD